LLRIETGRSGNGTLYHTQLMAEIGKQSAFARSAVAFLAKLTRMAINVIKQYA